MIREQERARGTFPGGPVVKNPTCKKKKKKNPP